MDWRTWLRDLWPNWDDSAYVADFHRRKHKPLSEKDRVPVLYVRGNGKWAVPILCPHCQLNHPNFRRHLEAISKMAPRSRGAR